ncbi:endoplasmic reticulum junction formation protein lunapark isoform X2 [Nilaparvata lugens]|uniref:endoplasmic reticulum junction formation protein lunapark isoform X2 n=1 Tax=Nilaparvata lugens TaxID=108931 RepID=UPI00193DC550|nr:endoplasmic reticulum junction formation protein lunapark isoform X2 [Nilaparvata lugens]
MGLIISRFRRKKTCMEELELIEEQIIKIEKTRQVTEEEQRRVIGKLFIYSVGAYILALALFYFFFFPATVRARLFYTVPLIIFPVIVFLLKKLISWFYIRRMVRQRDLLMQLKSDKRQLLDTVMEKETYKVARVILEKFAPDQLRSSKLSTPVIEKSIIPVKKDIVPVPNSNKVVNLPINPTITESGSELRYRTPTVSMRNAQPIGFENLGPAMMRSRPRPVLPRDPGLIERLVDSLVGDGPSHRYALICSSCHSHNGMALREEFPFLSYRCCYCLFYNRAKQQRPVPPKLLDKESSEKKEEDESTASDSGETSGSDFENIKPNSHDLENESR